jgi:hypothetical protein
MVGGRNSRCRIRHKLNTDLNTDKRKPSSVARVTAGTVSKEISQEEYDKYVSNIKLESSKRSPDINQLKELLFVTHVNRRRWIDSSPYSELRLSAVFEMFPCLSFSELLIHEMALFKGQEIIDAFPGITDFHYSAAI